MTSALGFVTGVRSTIHCIVSSGPVPYDLQGVARTTLSEADIDDLRVGAWILGTGGGGDPYFGYLCLKKLYAQGRVVDVIDPMDLPDDAYVAAVNQMGSPLPAEERLTDPATVTRAIREMEAYAGIGFMAVMPWEIGGGNAFQPLMAAAMLGLPVVDADAMGRAFPEAQMTSFAVMDFTCHPLVMADIRPNTVIISEAADWKWLERLRRRACTELGAVAATCNPPRTGREVKTGSHLHTVGKALRIGRTIRRAQAEHRDPVAALLHHEGGVELLRGKVTDVERHGPPAATSAGGSTSRVLTPTPAPPCALRFRTSSPSPGATTNRAPPRLTSSACWTRIPARPSARKWSASDSGYR